MSEVIEIVAYNPDWPRMFEDENGSEWSSFRLGTGVLLSRVASLWQAAQLSIEEQIATKIIDSTKQFEYTHGVNPKIQREIFVYIRGTKRASHPSDPPAELCRNLPLNFGIYIVLFTPFHLNQNDLLS